MVGKLLGQYSDSNRVSQSLQTPKKLKLYESREGERESILQVLEGGEDWLNICESLWKIASVFGSHRGDKTLWRGGGELTLR